MKVGVNLLNFGADATPAAFRQWAQAAEQFGYHFLMISDHVAVTPDVAQQYPAPFYDPFVALSWIAAITSKVEIGTTVAILPYRHPLLLARMAANIDQLSNGRFILGVGVGWAKQEYRALGVPFEQRGAIANEYLAAIRACWESDSASFHGRYVSFDDVGTKPRPVRSPHPPIWVGGKTDAALRRAVLYGDAFHPIVPSLKWAAEQLSRLREIAGRENKPVPAFCPRVSVRLTNEPLPDPDRPFCHGDAAQLRRDLAGLVELGAQYLLIDTFTGEPNAPQLDHGLRTLRALSEQVFDLRKQALR
jgi:probable F420-dependent oxidoreductase